MLMITNINPLMINFLIMILNVVSHLYQHPKQLEVLIVMNEMGLIPLVHLLTCFLHVFGQSRRAAAEHAYFTHLWKKRARISELKQFWIQLYKKVKSLRQGLTSGWTSCRELKKDTKGGRPKWVTERRPVKRLRFHTFWKWRSHTYCATQKETPIQKLRCNLKYFLK